MYNGLLTLMESGIFSYFEWTLWLPNLSKWNFVALGLRCPYSFESNASMCYLRLILQSSLWLQLHLIQYLAHAHMLQTRVYSRTESTKQKASEHVQTPHHGSLTREPGPKNTGKEADLTV